MSAPFVGSVPSEIARIIFDYAEPVAEPVPCAPTEWERESEHCRTEPTLNFDPYLLLSFV